MVQTPTDEPVHARWTIATPPRSHGAIAVISLESDRLDQDLAALGLDGPKPGGWRTADLLGVDRGVIARWTRRRADLMPHGGPLVVRRLTEALAARGCAHEPDPGAAAMYPEARSTIEARALAAVARARSADAVDLLLDQPRRWAEAGLNPDRTPAGDPRLADGRILQRLIDPPRVAALGPPNIGKSTLLNALARRTRAVVADQPGTTRDHIGVELDLAGLTVRYLDTPGLLERATGPDAEAIEAALAMARSAELILACGDPSTPPPETEAISPGAPVVSVCLRADLGPPEWPAEFEVVAPQRHGLERLATAVRARLLPQAVLEDPRPWRFWSGPHAAADQVTDPRADAAPDRAPDLAPDVAPDLAPDRDADRAR